MRPTLPHEVQATFVFEFNPSSLVIEAQRAAIVRLRNEHMISSEVMRRVERDLDLDLDLEASRLEV